MRRQQATVLIPVSESSSSSYSSKRWNQALFTEHGLQLAPPRLAAAHVAQRLECASQLVHSGAGALVDAQRRQAGGSLMTSSPTENSA
jgi:hypothetical protein